MQCNTAEISRRLAPSHWKSHWRIALNAATVAALGVPLLASAESSQIVNPTPVAGMQRVARVDFRITVYHSLFLQVGTGTAGASNPTVNLIDFVVPSGSVGNGVAVAGTGGDLGAGTVTARVAGNGSSGGVIRLTATTAGALSNGAGTTIPFSQINTTAAALSSGTVLSAPTLTNGTSGPVNLPLGAAKFVNRDARWTYSYANTTVLPLGTYGGVNTNNSRVTYTAVMP
jgi:hypothetical protein